MENMYLAIEGCAVNAEEAIRLCGKALQDADCVEDDFVQGCIQREKEYPTGICSEIPVAIPHCQSDRIHRNAVCYLRLEKPVEFYRMDDDEETISTRHILNLAIGGGDHLKFLQELMGILQDEKLLEQLAELPIEQVPRFLGQKIKQEDAV